MTNTRKITQQILAYHMMASCTGKVGIAMWRAALLSIRQDSKTIDQINGGHHVI